MAQMMFKLIKWSIKKRTGYSLSKLDVAAAAKQCTVPVLLGCANADTLVSPSHRCASCLFPRLTHSRGLGEWSGVGSESEPTCSKSKDTTKHAARATAEQYSHLTTAAASFGSISLASLATVLDKQRGCVERVGCVWLVRCSDLLYKAYGGGHKQLVHFEGDHNSQHHVLTFRARDLLTTIFTPHRCVV